MIPQDQVQPFTRSDIIGSMSFPTQMNNAMTLLVLVGEAVFAMIRCPHATTKLKSCACKVQTQANVEGHIRVIGVHIQTQIFTFTVSHDETMMSIPAASRSRKETFAQRLQQLLQFVDERLQADITQDDSFVLAWC